MYYTLSIELLSYFISIVLIKKNIFSTLGKRIDFIEICNTI